MSPGIGKLLRFYYLEPISLSRNREENALPRGKHMYIVAAITDAHNLSSRNQLVIHRHQYQASRAALEAHVYHSILNAPRIVFSS